jgi:acyl-coenzyme A synthetase/AMP-(fatty) acid ligase
VLECGVCGRPDDSELIKPIAFVVLREGFAATADESGELLRHVRERLSDYKRPRWIEFLDALPKTATGKIQRFKLRERAAMKP